MKVLVLGVSGMLGNVMFRTFFQKSIFQVFGTARSGSVRKHFVQDARSKIISGVDVENQDAMARLFSEIRPQVVVNCIGLVKQLRGCRQFVVQLLTHADGLRTLAGK